MPQFEWTLPVDDWKRCVGLIDGLLEADLPAHQYLTREGIDDALVEVAFME